MVRTCGWILAIKRFYGSDTVVHKHDNKIKIKILVVILKHHSHINDTIQVYFKRTLTHTLSHTYMHPRTYCKNQN